MRNKTRVLIVDDEIAILDLVRDCLDAEFEVIATQSGEEALSLVKTEGPDIILLDIFMMPLTGFDVLAKLRSFSQIPVIVFTARADIGRTALAEGANAFIAKPFIIDELVETIRNTLHKRCTPS